jgi:membrane protease YdiL (CAAX protease family)
VSAQQPGASGPRVSARTQLALMIGLWWRQMRRSSARVGAAPKQTGVPSALLINAFGSGYVGLLVWRSVHEAVAKDVGLYTWQLTGMFLLGLGVGVSKGSTKLQLRGTRNDTFLEPLPLTTSARLGLQFMDALGFLPLAVIVPLAAGSARSINLAQLMLPCVLGVFGFVSCFVWGRASIAWLRAKGPLASGRWGTYTGVALNLVGILLLVAPLEKVIGSRNPVWAKGIGEHGLHEPLTQLVLSALALLGGFLGYACLCSAERQGIDQLDAPVRAPRAQSGVRDRNALEWQMMLRQGGRALLIVFGLALISGLWGLIRAPHGALSETTVRMLMGFILYLGALQTIAHAGRAARADFQARAFLAALPLSPHQVLEGKSRALRKLLVPMFVALAALAIALFARGHISDAFRVLLGLAALYVVVDGAVSVSFLASGIGVWTLGGGQASSGFSTQLLMLPLLATAFAGNIWTATTALLALVAVTWESRRAARLSVRWLDDPADDTERETTVWRALLAATAFFALQAMSFQLFALFELPYGYLLALVFGSGAVLLALLTYRNNERFEHPAFLPRKAAAAWLLGPLLGAASGRLALALVPLLPVLETTPEPDLSKGEQVAVVFTMAVLAPLVEEYFFRGWLQRAIEADLPQAHKAWGFVLGASAFALSHLGTYGLPQLVLGLCAGWLFRYSGGLWPSILAHAAHNATVLLLSR